MPFQHINGLRYFHFDIFDGQAISHAIFTRHGGVSPMPWRSLNVGGTVGDDPVRVQENRRQVFMTLGRDVGSLHDVWQVHSANVVHAERPRGNAPPKKADIIMTSNPEITLFMRFADCVPIYLYDPQVPAICIAHAGWLGTVRRAAEVAVMAMKHTFGTSPENLLAGIGPSIGPDHYEVGEEVLTQFSSSFGTHASDHIVVEHRRSYLNLWSANRHLLEVQGVTEIETAGICTACENEDWFSHRAEHGETGRFAALLNLERA
jgi:YfiH family protein